MLTFFAHTFCIAVVIAVPLAFGRRVLRVDEDFFNAKQVLQVNQSESHLEGAPPRSVDLTINGWKLERSSNFKQFYASDSYPDWRIVVFKDSAPGAPSVTMTDEMDALSTIKSWKIQEFGVVDAFPVSVKVSKGSRVVAMALEWIDGDFFDIAKIPQGAAALILLIAARRNHDPKVNTSEMGMTRWETNLQRLSKNATTWADADVQQKLAKMYHSLSAIKAVEGSIVDLQVMVRNDGYMVIIDPLGVGKLREQSRQLGGNLMAPNFSNSREHVGNKFVEDATKWAEYRGAQTRNINEAVEALLTTMKDGKPPNPRKKTGKKRQHGASLKPV